MNRLDNKYINMFALFVLIFLLRMPRVSESLYFYGTHALNMMNPNYLANTPEVLGINHAISPRIFFDYLLYIPMRLGLSFEITAFIWNCIADLLFASGIVYLIRAVVIKRYFILSVLLLLCIRSTPIISSSFGFPYYYEQEPPLTLAISVEMIAISFALKGKWNIAFLMASLGALFHIHEGMYGGGIITVLFLLKCWHDKNINWSQAYMFLFWTCAILLLTMPTLLTDRTEIDNTEFCAFYRKWVGHMSFFSAMPSNVFYFLSAIGLYYISYEKLKGNCFICPLDFIIYMSIAVLGVVFIILFIDIFPLAIFYKLYFQKFFKYIALLIILQFVAYVGAILNERNPIVIYQRVLLLISNVFSPLIVVITAIFEKILNDKKERLQIVLLILTVIVDLFFVIKGGIYVGKMFVLFILAPFVVNYGIKHNYRIISFVSGLVLIIMCLNNYRRNWDNIFYSGSIDSKTNMLFYTKMKEIIPAGETYLVSPMLGRRSFTVNFSTGLSSYTWPGPPSTSIGTRINIDRYNEISGWEDSSYEEKVTKAKAMGIRFLLLQKSEAPQNAGEIYNDDFILVKVG